MIRRVCLKFLIASFTILLGFSVGGAYACQFPTGKEGDVVYNSSLSQMQYCSGFYWLDFPKSTEASSPCSSAGTMHFSDTQKVLQWCDGTNWHAAGPVPGSGGGGCNSPSGVAGDVVYNQDYKRLQYCDGTYWRGIGQDILCNGGGTPTTSFSYINSTHANTNIDSLAVQPDGKVIIGGVFGSYNGTTRARLARLNADGSLDTGFNIGTGVSATTYAIAVQPDGKILIGGNFTTYNDVSRVRIARLNADGSLDTGFDPGTGLDNYIYNIAVQPDGKILISGNFSTYNGTSRPKIARLNADGSLDTSFNPGTGANSIITAMSLLPDGKVMIGGSFTLYNGVSAPRLIRLNSDGTRDTGFAPGTGPANAVNSMEAQPDGKIVIAGSFITYNGTGRARVARVNTDGTLDATFNPGTGVDNIVNSLVLQPDGKIVIGGTFTSYDGTAREKIARLNANGTLDTSFNPGTGAGHNVTDLALSSGKIIAAGGFTTYDDMLRNRIVRINANGSVDTGFGATFGFNGTPDASIAQVDSKVIIGGNFTMYDGYTRNRLLRVHPSGFLDRSFDPGAGPNQSVLSIALQPDNKILIGGLFNAYAGTTRGAIARVNSDGTLDTSFNANPGGNGTVYAIAVQPDGKVLIGGNFTTYNGTSRVRIARLNADGSLDTSFDPGTGANSIVRAIVVQPDGKILIAGALGTYNGISKLRVARLNADGSLDNTFDVGTGANNSVIGMVLQPDGKILVGGLFTTFAGVSRARVARLNSDGSLDMSFDPGTGANDYLNSFVVQADGKIIIGGAFTSYNGTTRNKIARLRQNGALDTTFDPGAGANNLVMSIATQLDGNIVVSGDFTSFNGGAQGARSYAVQLKACVK